LEKRLAAGHHGFTRVTPNATNEFWTCPQFQRLIYSNARKRARGTT
jgi:hypothetical protein